MVAISKMDSIDVEYFIKSLSLPHNVARGVLRTEEDCKGFQSGFYGVNRNLIDDLLDYREHKIEMSDITVDDFTEACYNEGLQVAFEKTFFQSFSDDEIIKVAHVIATGKTSLEELHMDFQKNPNVNIMKYIL